MTSTVLKYQRHRDEHAWSFPCLDVRLAFHCVAVAYDFIL